MFSALLNAQNRGASTTPITGAVFQYSNDGTNWTNLPVLGVGITYDTLTYQLRVGSTTPAGATYTITNQGTATNQGQTANMIIVGSGSYTGSITSPTLQIITRTITATGNINTYDGTFNPDSCNIDGSVAGFNITLGNLVGSTGVSVAIFYGTDYNSAVFCSVSNNTNIEGRVSSLIGTNPYQNVVYNTNGVKTFYTNYNSVPSYFWCVVNIASWEIDGVTIDNPAYNSNFSTAIVSVAGFPAPFYDSCGT